MSEATERIDALLAGLPEWKRKTFGTIRKVVHEADPEIVEEWKYMGTPVWEHNGGICLANAFKDKVKVTFFEGAALADPDRLFNADLEGKQRRSIDYFEGDEVREPELKALVRAAVDLNLARVKTAARKKAAR